MVRKPATNKEKLLLILYRKGRMNTTSASKEMGKTYLYVRNLLHKMAKEKLLNDEYIRRYVPGLTWILMHEFWVSKWGKKWLKKENLISS